MLMQWKSAPSGVQKQSPWLARVMGGVKTPKAESLLAS